jgi:pyridoxal 5'-phosphate synthase pdxS subunit
MQLGAEAVFVGSGIFMGKRTKCERCEEDKHSHDETCAFAPPEEAERRARAIVKATTHYNDPKVLLEVSEDVPSAMKGLAVGTLDESQLLQTRGW